MSPRNTDESLEQLGAKLAAESNEGRCLAANQRRKPICTVSVDATVPCLVVT